MIELLYLLIRIRQNYETCPKCRQRWNARLRDRHTVIRVGNETFVCRCGDKHWTGLLEWCHLTELQRREYFVSPLEVGVLITCIFASPFFAYFIGDGMKSAATALRWGALIGLGSAAISWTIKILVIKISLRRCPHETGFVPGTAPWTW